MIQLIWQITHLARAEDYEVEPRSSNYDMDNHIIMIVRPNRATKRGRALEMILTTTGRRRADLFFNLHKHFQTGIGRVICKIIS